MTTRELPAIRINVLDPTKQRPGGSKAHIQCRLGRDVQIDHRILEEFCFAPLTDKEYDLLLLAGVVVFADKTCKRHRSKGWARDIHISMPVHDAVFWSHARIHHKLVDTLTYLTGDNWSIDFRGRVARDNFLDAQPTLPLIHRRSIVIPASHGLDSFAHSQLSKFENPDLEIVRVVSKNASIGAALQQAGAIAELQVPVRTSVKSGEPSSRTRSFLFFVVAGIACAKVRGSAVSIPENGQGSLGPSLTPDGNEWPYRGSHPAFTSRLGELMSLICETRVSYIHPRLWQTKGQVLTQLKSKGRDADWELTRSCPRDQRDLRFDGPKIECGICGGCLLRRMAAFEAQLTISKKYFWDDLNQSEMDDSIVAGARRMSSENDVNIFLSNSLAMSRLAEFASDKGDMYRFEQTVFELASSLAEDEEVVRARLRALLVQHSKEWQGFVSSLGASSWVRRYCFL